MSNKCQNVQYSLSYILKILNDTVERSGYQILLSVPKLICVIYTWKWHTSVVHCTKLNIQKESREIIHLKVTKIKGSERKLSQIVPLTRSLREPGRPCTKSMEYSESRMKRVNPMQTMQVCCSLLSSFLRPIHSVLLLKLYDVLFHYLINFFSECWCNGLLKRVPFTYPKICLGTDKPLPYLMGRNIGETSRWSEQERARGSKRERK